MAPCLRQAALLRRVRQAPAGLAQAPYGYPSFAGGLVVRILLSFEGSCLASFLGSFLGFNFGISFGNISQDAEKVTKKTFLGI